MHLSGWIVWSSHLLLSIYVVDILSCLQCLRFVALHAQLFLPLRLRSVPTVSVGRPEFISRVADIFVAAVGDLRPQAEVVLHLRNGASLVNRKGDGASP